MTEELRTSRNSAWYSVQGSSHICENLCKVGRSVEIHIVRGCVAGGWVRLIPAPVPIGVRSSRGAELFDFRGVAGLPNVVRTCPSSADPGGDTAHLSWTPLHFSPAAAVQTNCRKCTNLPSEANALTGNLRRQSTRNLGHQGSGRGICPRFGSQEVNRTAHVRAEDQ